MNFKADARQEFNTKTLYLTQLPHESLGHIFSYLDSFQDVIKSVQMVCKRFNAVVRSDAFCEDIAARHSITHPVGINNNWDALVQYHKEAEKIRLIVNPIFTNASAAGHYFSEIFRRGMIPEWKGKADFLHYVHLFDTTSTNFSLRCFNYTICSELIAYQMLKYFVFEYNLLAHDIGRAHLHADMPFHQGELQDRIQDLRQVIDEAGHQIIFLPTVDDTYACVVLLPKAVLSKLALLRDVEPDITYVLQ